MLIALALYFIHRVLSVYALPLPLLLSSSDSGATFLLPSTSSCQVSDEGRSVWDIFWSCIATIFSCTWVAIHPNIASPKESWPKRNSRRLGITLMALIAPEAVIMWAMREWIAAHKWRDLYREHGWTVTHGFFALMGGFMLCDEQGPLRVLQPDELQVLEQSDIIEFPDITAAEIKDKSKGDLLSKGLAVLQTGWFIIQCCARRIEGLPITELEIVTLGYAAVNFVTYSVWWHKPLNVQHSCRVKQLKKQNTIRPKESRALSGATLVTGDINGDSTSQPKTDDSLMDVVGTSSGGRCAQIINRLPDFLKPFFKGCASLRLLYVKTISLPLAPFSAMAKGNEWGDKDSLRVRTFSSAEEGGVPKSVLISVACVSTIYGAIHCIAWNAPFPTALEQLFWRIASVAITGIPFFYNVLNIYVHPSKIPQVRGCAFIISALFLSTMLGLVSLYIAARLDLLVQAFISLRDLPPNVLETVDWTAFMPHI